MKKIKLFTLAVISALSLMQCKTGNKTPETGNKSKETKQIIVDVRTPEEWQNDGHADCSVNYPLDIFDSKIEELKKYDKVVLVCRSGNRSGKAKQKLLYAGYTNEVENGGAWQNITCKK